MSQSRLVHSTTTTVLHRYTAANLYLKLLGALADAIDLQQDSADEIRERLAEGLRTIEHIYDPSELYSSELTRQPDQHHPDLELTPDITDDDSIEVSLGVGSFPVTLDPFAPLNDTIKE